MDSEIETPKPSKEPKKEEELKKGEMIQTKNIIVTRRCLVTTPAQIQKQFGTKAPFKIQSLLFIAKDNKDVFRVLCDKFIYY